MITRTITPPCISFGFDGDLLMSTLQRMDKSFRTKICPLAERKIKPEHVGRRREFDKMKAEFEELYERKKAEEADYSAEISKKIKERPRFSASGKTMFFKRIQSVDG